MQVRPTLTVLWTPIFPPIVTLLELGGSRMYDILDLVIFLGLDVPFGF